MVEITSWLSPAAAAWCAGVDRFRAVYPEGGYVLAAGVNAEDDEPRGPARAGGDPSARS